MALTKRQKILGGVMLIAAGCFVWDRVNSPPAAADAASPPATSLLIAPTSPQSVTDKPSSPIAATTMPSSSNLGAILLNIAAAQKLNCRQSGDAFALPEAWQAAKATAAPPPPPQVNVDRERAAQFAAKHHLDAVMVGSARGGYAIIDGHGVDVGQAFDGFTLLSVDTASVTFSRGRIRLHLKLIDKSDVTREGSVIENSGPASKSD